MRRGGSRSGAHLGLAAGDYGRNSGGRRVLLQVRRGRECNSMRMRGNDSEWCDVYEGATHEDERAQSVRDKEEVAP